MDKETFVVGIKGEIDVSIDDVMNEPYFGELLKNGSAVLRNFQLAIIHKETGEVVCVEDITDRLISKGGSTSWLEGLKKD